MVDISYRTVIVTKCMIGSLHTEMLAIIHRVLTYKMVVPYSITSS
jgi:hypothetical protein